MEKEIIVEVSARHIHLTTSDLEALFGEGYKLTKEKDLAQKGQYAAKETVKLIGPRGELTGVKVLGPCRNQTQIEISLTDSFKLGVKAPIRLSGKIIGSGAIKLVGSKGELELTEGLIVAKRHIHLSTDQANEWGLTNGKTVKIKIEGPRALVLDEVEVRVDDDFETAVHLDTDEANAAGLGKGGRGMLII